MSSMTSASLVFLTCRAGNPYYHLHFPRQDGKARLPVQLGSRVGKRKEEQTRGAAKMGLGQWPELLDGPSLRGEGQGWGWASHGPKKR